MNLLKLKKREPTAKEALSWAVKQLQNVGLKHSYLEGELLVALAMDCPRQNLLIYPDRNISKETVNSCRQLIERRCAREPIHYILGTREFWSLDFKVTPDVLIPRPETEILIEHLANLQNTIRPDFFLLDIGTGSGNLSVAAAKEWPQSKVVAMDRSISALEIAAENAQANEVSSQIRFICSDILQPGWKMHSRAFDVVMSNPPYIESRKIDLLMPEIKYHEPLAALDAGNSGMRYYESIVPWAFEQLRNEGYLILEIGEKQDQSVSALMASHFEHINVIADYSGRPRVVSGRKPTSHG